MNALTITRNVVRQCRPLTSRTRSTLAFIGTAIGLLCATSLVHAASPAEPFQRDQTPLPASISSIGTSVDTPDPLNEEGDPAPGGGSSGGTLVRMVVGLAIVLAVIYGVYWLLRTQRRSKGMQSDERIGVLATTTLAPNRTIHLIRVGDELLLVGAAENSISPLRSYTAEEAASLEQQFGIGVDGDFMPLDASPASPVVERFAEGLRRRTMRE